MHRSAEGNFKRMHFRRFIVIRKLLHEGRQLKLMATSTKALIWRDAKVSLRNNPVFES